MMDTMFWEHSPLGVDFIVLIAEIRMETYMHHSEWRQGKNRDATETL